MRGIGREMCASLLTPRRHLDRSMMPSTRTTILCLLLASSIALTAAGRLAPASPQSAAPGPANPQATIKANVDLVVVPVTVKSSNDETVDDLRRDEFRVFEDNVEQRITTFSNDAIPLSAVLLVDDDMSTKPADQVQKSLVAMAGAFGPDDEVALAKFDAFYTPVVDFTADNDKLITELGRLTLGRSIPGVGSDVMTSVPTVNNEPVSGAPIPSQPTRGQTTKHIDDAIHAAAEALSTRDRDRRKVIVLVSDGMNAKNNTYSYDDTLKVLLSSDVSVYAIGLDAAILNRVKSVLARYAHSTGGDVDYAVRGSDLPDIYTQVTEQARHQYTLGYVPAGTDRSKNYHSIEVRVRRPGLNILTREGYYLVASQ